jgi:hypothetical protein
LLRLPPLLLPELRLPPELDFEPEGPFLTEEEFRELFPLVELPEDFVFTDWRGLLVPEVPFWLCRGLTVPRAGGRSPEDDRPERLLPGRTCWVRLFRLLLEALRPEFQTRVPFWRGVTGVKVRWLASPRVPLPILRSVTSPPVRLRELPRTVVGPLDPRLTGTRPDLVLDPPARCLKSEPVSRPAPDRERDVAPPPRIRKPALVRERTASSKRGRAREAALTPPTAPARAPVVARLLERPFTPSKSESLVRLLIASL